MSPENPPARRNLKPKERPHLAPIAVSDETCIVAGFASPRRFREFVARHALPFVLDGRRVIVTADALRAALERLAGEGAIGGSSEAPTADTVQPTSGEAVLRRLGFKRIAGGKQ